jgi:hypothetical protein
MLSACLLSAVILKLFVVWTIQNITMDADLHCIPGEKSVSVEKEQTNLSG